MGITVQVAAAKAWAGAAADVVQRALQRRPDAVVGFPTGRTPLPLFAELRRRAERGELDAGRMRVVMLDDYLDTGRTPQNLYCWLKRELLDPLAVGAERLLRIPTQPDGLEARCARFEQDLAAWGGCELLLLGLGANGHIGFNEPGAAADSRTRLVRLSLETARANAEYWAGAMMPQQAVTMGVATILAARQICLLVRGRKKARMLRRALLEPAGPEVPASYLQQAERSLVIADPEAAAGLPAEICRTEAIR